MRFVLVSTHVDQTTGYAKVAYNLLRQLATLSPKVKTYHFGFQRHPNAPGMRKPPAGVIAYDAAANEDPKEEGFGFNKINEYIEMVQPDIVMIYNDPLIIHRFIEAMKHERGKSPYKLWLYVDQVYNGIAQPLIDSINKHADRIYLFTEIWEKVFKAYGPCPETRVLEHAVDPSMFTNMPLDARAALRANVNLPTNSIIFLNANRNSQRKRLDMTIAGFVRLLNKHRDKPLYMLMATNINPQNGAYYDINRVFATELQAAGLPVQEFALRLLIVDTSPPNVIGDNGINDLYNITDIGINTSDGEGFGLCQLEHMYTGAPQIVVDVGSYRSFLDEKVAEFIPTKDNVYFSGTMPLGLYAPSFEANAVADAMERAIITFQEKRAAVSSYNFKSWSTVCDGWLEDVIASIESA